MKNEDQQKNKNKNPLGKKNKTRSVLRLPWFCSIVGDREERYKRNQLHRNQSFLDL